MSELAFIVLVHRDPEHLRRLAAAIAGAPLFIHCDAKVGRDDHALLRRAAPQATWLPQQPASLYGWALVSIELAALRTVLGSTAARHIAVLSGADYPLAPLEELVSVLRSWEGVSMLASNPLPYAGWTSPRHGDGGRWRFSRRTVRRGDHVVTVAGRPLLWPGHRDVPAGLEPHAGSQWKIYAREDAQMLLSLVERHPALVDYWRGTFVPDESFAATMLGSPAYAGSRERPATSTNAWYYDFSGRDHPRWLGDDDFPALLAARQAPAPRPDDLLRPHGHQRLFARKFQSASAGILDRVEAELRR